jgi:hypothetical protein
VTPMVAAEDVDLRWYVGLDTAGTAIGDAIWNGETPAASLVGLFALTFDGSEGVAPDAIGRPVYLLIGLDHGNVIRFKPQNLVTGLPLVDRMPELASNAAGGSA